MTLFINLLDIKAEEKAPRLKLLLREDARNIREVSLDELGKIPGTPMSYWVSQKVRSLFSELSRFESGGRIARKGLTTSNDFRYVRLWWEVELEWLGKKWATYAKGGSARTFYSNFNCVVLWDWERRTIPGYIGRPGRESEKVECADLMGRAGITWPLRAGRFCPSALPAESVFSARGYVIQAPIEELRAVLAFTSSHVFDYVFKTCLGRFEHPEFIVGILQRLPMPQIGAKDASSLTVHAQEAWTIERSRDSFIETSLAFIGPTLTNGSESASHMETRLQEVRASIDGLCMEAFGLKEGDCPEWKGAITSVSETSEEEDDDYEEDNEDTSDENANVDERWRLLSWAVGVAFGRFDIRVATGERFIPNTLDPFAALPPLSAGMRDPKDPVFFRGGVTNNQALQIIVDDREGVIYGDIADIICRVVDEVSKHVALPELSGLSRNEIRTWIGTAFFPFHIKMYSKSRRKAPVYWQLATPSTRYSVWLYIHEFSDDTFFRVQKIVDDKAKSEQKALDLLRSEAGSHPSSAQKKEIEAQEAFVSELQTMLDEVRRVAPLWNPNLDDGVIINAAPLWRLFPQHKPWQKECKATWDALCKGDYDWSHLAMHLWPERVVPKCAGDRSLAIAHGLEDVFWFEDEDGKWKPLDKPVRPMDTIIAERTWSAVKAALKSLLEAPDTTFSAKRTRKTKTA